MEAIKGYTIAQVSAYLAAIERMTAQRRLGDAVALRMAQADAKAWRAYIRRLERAANGENG